MVATDLTTANLQDQIDADLAERTRVHQKAIARFQAASEVASQMSVSAIARPFVMLAIGDSWYDYPLLNNGPSPQRTDLIFQLQSYGTHPVTSLNYAHFGDASTDMMSVPKQERVIAALRDKNNWLGGKPQGILVSAGGNDVVGRFGVFLDFNDGRSSGLNLQRFNRVLDVVSDSYHTLFDIRDKYAPGTPIFAHDYDYPIPNGVHPLCAGPWLKPALDLNHWSQAEGERIVKDALKRFASMLAGLADDPKNNFHHLKTQGMLKRDEWANELHPTYLGFRKVTKLFYDKLRGFAAPAPAAEIARKRTSRKPKAVDS
ncbi:SGNH/GDSL hydrolase family protein [Allorhizobium ampelinum]|uniref:SGNH/GDSL hydrolase family protein n=1 Tax=Allorhizobium ampelinum TaxID=3025782 RepID=UPI001F289DF8|nr:SGNH/GDSL hydrolase family protein [Allorhizobium ampelinum]